MTRLVTSVLVVSLMSSAALAQAKRHLFMFKTEHEAQQHCEKDTVVWADTRTTSCISQGTGIAATPTAATSVNRRPPLRYHAPRLPDQITGWFHTKFYAAG